METWLVQGTVTSGQWDSGEWDTVRVGHWEDQIRAWHPRKETDSGGKVQGV